MKLENAQAAMQIILHAGDARLKTAEALKSLKTFDIERAKQQLLDANEDIVAAHQSQTASLQAESNGEDVYKRQVHCMGRGADAASHKIVQTCFVEKKNAAAFL